MAERAYTVGELDELRAAVEERWLFGRTNRFRVLPPGTYLTNRSHTPEEKAAAVEEIMRTHLLLGHVAEDLYEADR